LTTRPTLLASLEDKEISPGFRTKACRAVFCKQVSIIGLRKLHREMRLMVGYLMYPIMRRGTQPGANYAVGFPTQIPAQPTRGDAPFADWDKASPPGRRCGEGCAQCPHPPTFYLLFLYFCWRPWLSLPSSQSALFFTGPPRSPLQSDKHLQAICVSFL
jgi:hypothetical protein